MNLLIKNQLNVTFVFLFTQPELYLCTPIKVDYTNDYYIGELVKKMSKFALIIAEASILG